MDILVLQNTTDTKIIIKEHRKYFTIWSRLERIFNGIESVINHLLRVSVAFTVKLLNPPPPPEKKRKFHLRDPKK